MSGHHSSRRRAEGRRQKDLRDRREIDLSIDLEGPTAWPRGGAWDAPSSGNGSGEMRPQRSGGPS